MKTQTEITFDQLMGLSLKKLFIDIKIALLQVLEHHYLISIAVEERKPDSDPKALQHFLSRATTIRSKISHIQLNHNR